MIAPVMLMLLGLLPVAYLTVAVSVRPMPRCGRCLGKGAGRIVPRRNAPGNALRIGGIQPGSLELPEPLVSRARARAESRKCSSGSRPPGI
jgi:hypothetical protein